MIPSSKPSVSVSALLLCLVLLVPLFSGCFKNPLGGDDSAPPPRVVKASPLDEARNAIAKSDFAKAETLAMRLSTDTTLNAADSAEVSRILAVAAMRNEHPSVAVAALDKWRTAKPGADGTREWQDLWCKAMGKLSPHDARTRASAVYQDESRTPLVRSIAGVFLAVRQWEDGELGQSLTALENIYTSARNNADKKLIEGRLAMQLHQANPAAAALVASAPTPENQGKFPYSIILIDKLRRAGATAELDQLSKQITIADPALFKGPPAEVSSAFQAAAPTAPIASGPISGQPVVLALPLSGQYAAISGKISAGAQIACDELSASGRPVTLIVIDTDQPDWLARLDGLPKNAALIGGPLRRDDYLKAKTQGVTSRRAMFAFLPSLEPGDEGRTAWRFFSSARDQVDTLLTFTSRLGISGYATFYPDENFGQRMAALFKERATASGAKSVTEASYSPSDPSSWLRSVGSLLSDGKTKTFRAVFLPDTWKNMDVIVPNIFYYNETRQVLLGTSLWEQGLTPGTFVSPQYYGLAVFPGAWNGARPSAAGAKLQSGLQAAGKAPADFWAGLGYDFARLSAGLGVGEGWNASTVNSALQSPSLGWSIAPIRWSSEGTASQEMFLFAPSEGGFKPVNEQEFRKEFAAAWQ